jgi:hypothetical protein
MRASTWPTPGFLKRRSAPFRAASQPVLSDRRDGDDWGLAGPAKPRKPKCCGASPTLVALPGDLRSSLVARVFRPAMARYCDPVYRWSLLIESV